MRREDPPPAVQLAVFGTSESPHRRLPPKPTNRYQVLAPTVNHFGLEPNHLDGVSNTVKR